MIVMSMLDLSEIEGAEKKKEFKPIYSIEWNPDRWEVPDNKINEVIDKYNSFFKKASEVIQNQLEEIRTLNSMVKGRDATIKKLNELIGEGKDYTYIETFSKTLNHRRGYKSDD